MGFRDQDDSEFFEIVRVNRATGEKRILADRDLIEGRWNADNVVKKMMEENRDPSITFEVAKAGAAKKKFRAAAFGDATERLGVFKEPGEK